MSSGSASATTLTIIPVTGMPDVRAGDDLAGLVVDAAHRLQLVAQEGDVLVVSSKVASKALGLLAPDRESAIDAETVRVVAERISAGRLTRVVESAAGPVMAAAGVDASNTGDRSGAVLLLPRDPDAVCRELRSRWQRAFGVERLAVVLSDTAGRPWRSGQVDFALGAAGLAVVDDLRGTPDSDGRTLGVTTRAIADEIASAADLVKGKVSQVPVALVRGLGADGRTLADRPEPGAASLVRTGAGDWFAHGHVEAVRAALGIEPGSELAQQIGIPDVTPESAGVRTGRAVAMALQGLDSVGVDVATDADPSHVVLSGQDPVDLGLAAARLCVALWSEGLGGRIPDALHRGPESVTVEVFATG